MLAVENVTAFHGRVAALRGATAAFAPGRLTALVGPNGSGKTSLIKAMIGLLPMASGQVLLDGAPAPLTDRRQLARRIAYLPQESRAPDHMRVGDLVELAGHARYALFGGPSAEDRRLFREALETVGLSDQAHRPVNALSGGQRQRAWIAMALAQDAGILLLDEPANHLDLRYQYAVMGLLKDLSARRGLTVAAVLHDLNLAAAFADDLVMMRDGEVVAAGPLAETLTEATLARVFDLEAEILTRGDRLVCLPRRPAEAAPLCA